MAKILVALPGQPEAVHELKGSTVTIGRLPDNDIPLPDRSVSGHHAKLVQVGGAWHVTDLDSLNKTWLHGTAVTEAPLIGEVSLRFGSVICTFIGDKGKVEESGKEPAVNGKRSGPPKPAEPAPEPAVAGSAKELADRVKQALTARDELDRRAAKLEAERAENQKQVAAALDAALKQLAGTLAERDTLRKERAELSTKLEAGSTEQTKLSAALTETKKQVENAAAERDALRKERAELNTRLEVAKTALATAEGNLKDVTKEKTGIAEDLAKVKEEVQALSKERDALRKQLEETAAQRKAAEERIAAVSSESTSAGERLRQLEEECEDTKAELEAVRTELAAAEKERDGIAHAKLVEEERLETLELELNEIQVASAAADEKMTAVQGELDAARKDVEKVRKEKEDLAAQHDAELKKAAEQLALRAKEAETLATERDALRKQLEDAAVQRKAAEERIAAVASNSSAAGEQVRRVEQECLGVKADLEAAKAELTALRKERDEIEGANAAAEARISALEKDLGKAREAKGETGEQVAALQRELEQARKEKEDLAAQHDAELKKAQAQIIDFQAQQEKLTAELKARHSENGSASPGRSPSDLATPRRGGPPVAMVTKPAPDSAAVATAAPAAKPARPRPSTARQGLNKAGVDGVAAMRGFIHHLIQHRGDSNYLRDFVAQVGGIIESHTDLPGYKPILRLADRIDALASDLIEEPRRLGPRMLRSLLQGVDMLALLFDESVRERAAEVDSRVVLIGCDEGECGPLVEALREANFEPEFAPSLEGGFKNAKKGGAVTLVCLDAGRGGLTPELAISLKNDLPTPRPPVLLLADKSPVSEWARWSACGVSDFLLKPVHPLELALKSLSLVYLASMAGK